MKPQRVTQCDICATPEEAADLAHIVSFCADQAGLVLALVTTAARPNEAPTITLHLGPDDAGPGHPTLCFACHLACLCPQARIGTLVHAPHEFSALRRHQA